jgi:hypothetical protein
MPLMPGVSWESLFDGRPHRLKLGKHFTGDVRTLQAEAGLAADRAGRGLLSVRDELGRRNHYLWVQFPDQALVEGEPCRCGGITISRLHEHLGRCDACGATASLQAASDGLRGRRLGHRLSDYDDVELVSDDVVHTGVERWYGRGIDIDGRPVLLVVDYPIHEGHRLPDPLDPDDDLHRTRRWSMPLLVEAARLGVFNGWPPGEQLRAALDVAHDRRSSDDGAAAPGDG